jgi:D-arabinose 1-dehydrogenase-like Zn-dependent alcohol dehydrogenase
LARTPAYAGLRRGGRLALVALPAAGTLSIPVFDTVLNGVSVIGSIVGTRADLLDVFALQAAGQTRVSYETRPLGSVGSDSPAMTPIRTRDAVAGAADRDQRANAREPHPRPAM